MKKLVKIFASVLALAIGVFSLFTLSACQDIRTAEVKLTVYNYTEGKFEDLTLTVDLYRHVAPKTVDNVISAINDGYYNGTIAYRLSGTNYLMIGEYKADGQDIIKQADRPMVEGEFKANGLDGNNLLNKKGNIGLYRSYTKDGGSFKVSDSGRNSGTAVWYMPTTTKTDMDGYFAVFAKIDLDVTANADAFSAIQTALTGSNFEEYEVFYTVEEDESLTIHIVKTTDFEESEDYDLEANTYMGAAIYEAKGSDLVSLNKKTVLMPKLENGARAVVVNSVKMK